jgi:peptidoglycan hydrolase-like protein with peptidoglycan-binding domain
MTGWSQTSPKGAESSTGRSSMDSMQHSSASGQWSAADVKSVQEALKNKGHNPGPIDGVMGARTQQALRAFQRAQNIQTSGQLDSSTASALGVTLSSASGSSSSSGSSGSGSSGAGSVGSGTSVPPSKSTTIDPNEGNPKDRGAEKSGTNR